jgi:hypothetical protein
MFLHLKLLFLLLVLFFFSLEGCSSLPRYMFRQCCTVITSSDPLVTDLMSRQSFCLTRKEPVCNDINS